MAGFRRLCFCLCLFVFVNKYANSHPYATFSDAIELQVMGGSRPGPAGTRMIHTQFLLDVEDNSPVGNTNAHSSGNQI